MEYRKKFQSGGQIFDSGVADPFFGSGNQLAGGAAASGAGSKKASDLLSDEFLDKLLAKGITTDVNKFTDMLIDLESKSRFRPVSKSSMYKLRAYANQILNQATDLKIAEEESTKNGALGEIAVDSRGFMFVKTEKGSLEKVHMSQYSPGSYIGLTYGELINERKKNPALVDNDQVVSAIKNGVGMDKINEYIHSIIKTIGSAENSTEAYHELVGALGKQVAKQPTEQQQAALAEMQDMYQKLGPDAIFKIKEAGKSKNINEAFNYIYSMLPTNMRMQLQADYVAKGGDYKTSHEHVGSLIGQALTMTNDTRTEFGIDYDNTINKAANTKSATQSSESTAQKNNLKPLDILVQGTLNKTSYTLRAPGTNVAMTLQGNEIGSLADTAGKPISSFTPLGIALEEGLGPLIDKSHMTMGNQALNPAMLDKIIYDGQKVANIWAPVGADGNIDFDGLEAFNGLLEMIKTNPSLTTEDKNKIMQNAGYNGVFDDNGNFKGLDNSVAQFIVLTGITSNDIVDPDANPYADQVFGQVKESEKAKIAETYAIFNKHRKGDAKLQTPLGFFHRQIVHVPIFMKLSNTAQVDAGAYGGKGPLVATKTYDEQIAYDQNRYLRENTKIQTPSSSFLY